MILKSTILTRLMVWHWTLVGAAASGLLVFSVATGYPPATLLRAQTAPQAATLVREGVVVPQRQIFFKSALSEDKQREIFEKLKEAPEVSINLENKPDSPVTVVPPCARLSSGRNQDQPRPTPSKLHFRFQTRRAASSSTLASVFSSQSRASCRPEAVLLCSSRARLNHSEKWKCRFLRQTT